MTVWEFRRRTVWEFRRRVRARRALVREGCCPLGAALAGPAFFNPAPLPTMAEKELGLPWGYVVGVIAGFDNSTPENDLPSSTFFDAGERYGRRMRRVFPLSRGATP